MNPIELKRNCPDCNQEIFYTTKNSYHRAERNSVKCRKCCLFKKKKIDKEEVLKYYNQNLNDYEIAEKLECERSSVAKTRISLGLPNLIDKRVKIEYVDSEHIKCSKCKTIKHVKNFRNGRPGCPDAYRFSFCDLCRKTHSNKLQAEDVNLYLIEKYRRSKGRASREGLEFSLSRPEWVEIYHSQKGLCFYTDEKMVWEPGKGHFPNTISVDRIDNNKGYVKNNVVFCCRRINTVKSNFSLEELQKYMPFWFWRIYVKSTRFTQTI